MEAERTARLDCLAVVDDDELLARIREVFDAWHLRFERVDQATALARVGHGDCRVVVIERHLGLRIYLERLRAAGAVPVVLGASGADVTPDIECVARPSELVASVFRAQAFQEDAQPGTALDHHHPAVPLPDPAQRREIDHPLEAEMPGFQHLADAGVEFVIGDHHQAVQPGCRRRLHVRSRSLRQPDLDRPGAIFIVEQDVALGVAHHVGNARVLDLE